MPGKRLFDTLVFLFCAPLAQRNLFIFSAPSAYACWGGGGGATPRLSKIPGSAPYLYINSGQWYQCHVPSTFATVNTHANVFFVFLPGGISKEWLTLFRQIVTLIGNPCRCLCNVYGPFGQDLGERKNSSRE